MSLHLSAEQQAIIDSIGKEPFHWLRRNIPEVKQHEDEIFDLVHRLVSIWNQCRAVRVNLCFELNWQKGVASPTQTIRDYEALQRLQTSKNSTLIFNIDLDGNIIGQEEMPSEIEPASVQMISEMAGCLLFWLGHSFGVYYKGKIWRPQNKEQILRDMSSKRREQLLSMSDYKNVLDIHYSQYVRGEAGMIYWVPGKKNEILLPNPERIFQTSLFAFLDKEIEGDVSKEPMFRDQSRCDIKILDDYDLYFIEIKWIGRCARKDTKSEGFTCKKPWEFRISRAVKGAYQTKRYLDENNNSEFDHKIKLGIYLVYDAYPEPKRISYGDEIDKHVLLRPVEYSLVSLPPSRTAQKAATRARPVRHPKRRRAPKSSARRKSRT